MSEIVEKFVIKITDDGLIIQDMQGDMPVKVVFSPSQALMLLDMLKKEEDRLTKLAREKSPLPFKIEFS